MRRFVALPRIVCLPRDASLCAGPTGTAFAIPAVLAVLAILATAPAAAAPVVLAVQGALSSAGGGPVADGSYALGVALYAEASGGDPLFNENLLSVKVEHGVFAFEIGSNDKTKIVDSALFEASQARYVGIQVGGDPEMPRVPLRPAPYAVHALSADVALGLDCSGCVGQGALADGAVTAAAIAPASIGDAHLQFSYAAALVKGGPATDALHADKATLADQATLADKAVSATSADEAASAQVAQKLACTGCVGLDHLGADVTGHFVATAGGKIAGDLHVTGAVQIDTNLALGKATISGGRFAAVDAKAAPCDGSNLGQVVLDAATKRLFLCDGSLFVRILTCGGACKPAGQVACGQPLIDDCGDVCPVGGTGTWCVSGACDGSKCVGYGESAASPAASCADLIAKVPAAASGAYWLKPASAPAYQVYCDMDQDDGGWTLAGRILGTDTTFSPVGAAWTDAKTIAADTATDLGNVATMKSQAWVDLPGTVVRVCFSGPATGCANFSHAKGVALSALFLAPSHIDTSEKWTFASLRTALERPQAFGAAFQYCGINYATSPAGSTKEVDINSLKDGSPGTAMRIGCIGDGSATAAGGPDDYALGIGVSSCLDGHSCPAVGVSPSLHWRDAGSNGTYALTAFIWVR